MDLSLSLSLQPKERANGEKIKYEPVRRRRRRTTTTTKNKKKKKKRFQRDEKKKKKKKKTSSLSVVYSRDERERETIHEQNRERSKVLRGGERPLCASLGARFVRRACACVSGAHPGERETV